MFALVWFWDTRDTTIIHCDEISELNDRKKGAVAMISYGGKNQLVKVIDVSGK